MPLHPGPRLLLLLLLVPGCFFTRDIEKSPSIDADGDRAFAVSDGGTDCDDEDPEVHPGADEQCDGIDNDCNGLVDDRAQRAGFLDEDGDGYGTGDLVVTCDDLPLVLADGDCDDADASLNPDAVEHCDGVDNDCDGDVDEEPARTYIDADGDGYGDSSTGARVCEAGRVDEAGDCDDGDPAISPDAVEVCNGVDDNCDGTVDEGATPVSWYPDGDVDGFGTGTAVVDCAPPATGTWSDNDLDCNDLDATVFPGAPEVCNGEDDNCSGAIDEGLVVIDWYVDADEDGYGASNTLPVSDCADLGVGWSGNGDDCDDGDPAIKPGALEVWYDGVDQDCSGGSDHDQDGDGVDWAGSGGTDRNDQDVSCSVTCADGSSIYASGPSCEGIHAQYPAVPDGSRWIDPNDDDDFSDAIEVWCDMSTDGGGWSLIWKTEPNATFTYASTYWTTTALLNENDLSPAVGTAKLRGFNVLPFDDIRVCTNVGCYAHTMSTPYSSALALFSGPFLNESITTNQDYDDWNALFGATGYADCPPGQRPGFNLQGAQGTAARWGLIGNHPNQVCQNALTDDADGVIGLGFVSDDEAARQEGSAGFNSSHTNLHGASLFARQVDAWLWVR